MSAKQTELAATASQAARRRRALWLPLLIVTASMLISAGLALIVAPPFAPHAMFIGAVCSFAVHLIVQRLVKRYSTLLQAKNEELAERNDELESVNQLLAEGNAELAAFAHTVAHDLKGPLTGLLAEADLLESTLAVGARQQAPDQALSEASELSQRVGQDCQRMASIIDELMLLSSVRQESVTPTPLDMGSLVAQALGRLDHLVNEKGATIHLPDSWPPCVGHAAWVRQVWVNYISNALKYGGDPPVLELGGQQIGRQSTFWVEDNGIGLSTTDQSRIFEEFYRTPQGQARASGHGLGLWIVRRICDRLGGSVSVYGKPGEGSRFLFTLPVD